MIRTRLDHLLTGTPQPFRGEGETSAIAKTPIDRSLMLGFDGLEGNRIADSLHHGGPDKAVHLYPVEHYAFWRDQYPDVSLLEQPGAFGENFSCERMVETQLCLGDIFRVGEALIECSHARQPCWKLNHRFGKSDVMKTMIQSGKSGSYFRVLEEGRVKVGDEMVRQDQPLPEWPLERLFGLIIAGRHQGHGAELKALSKNPILAASWRMRAAELADA